MIMAPIKLSSNPFLAICAIVSLLVPKTMALGGVATGSINAIEPDKVAGSISNSGFIPLETAMPAKMGRIISVVAVLEVSSVKKKSLARQ